MLNPELFRPSPWDRAVFNMPCHEILRPDRDALLLAAATPGHYTVKIDPLADKSALHEYGFYYADSLVEPCCSAERFIAHPHPAVHADRDAPLDELLPMCEQSFRHGRFHRDFNLSQEAADRRYQQWLAQLHAAGQVFALRYDDRVAAFIAFSGGNLLLHAIAESFRGRRLGKYLWSTAIARLIDDGETEIRSSISATNLAALNLYISLGFRFDHAIDVYHRLTR
jgi:ribosomal protein S18 acetylase RimI-like enzyme